MALLNESQIIRILESNRFGRELSLTPNTIEIFETEPLRRISSYSNANFIFFLQKKFDELGFVDSVDYSFNVLKKPARLYLHSSAISLAYDMIHDNYFYGTPLSPLPSDPVYKLYGTGFGSGYVYAMHTIPILHYPTLHIINNIFTETFYPDITGGFIL